MVAESEEERKAAFRIREEVFIREQGCDPGEEWDRWDSDARAVHILCTEGDEPVGAGRLLFLDQGAKLERIAVPRPYRARGIGSALVRFMISLASRKGVETIYAHVQTSAVDFYKGLGFRPVGDTFQEAGIEHVKAVYGE